MAEKPFGYIILEDDNGPNEISNLEQITKPNVFFIRFDTVLQSLDCINRNRRNYNGDALVKGLSDPNLDELMSNNKWKGERDHPITKDIQRIATVLSKQCSHRIKKWWREGNLIKGTIETLDDGVYGTALTKNILQGENPSFSLRALASLEKKGNVSYINRPPKVITYDEVNLPSHKEAYAEPRKTKVISDGNSEYTYENVKVTNGEIAIEAADIKDYLVSKSDNLKIVCESFNIDPATVKLIGGGRQLSAKSGNDTLVWTLESNLCRETADMWRYFSR